MATELRSPTIRACSHLIMAPAAAEARPGLPVCGSLTRGRQVENLAEPSAEVLGFALVVGSGGANRC